MSARPVVGLDIDGTLMDYHRHFIAFAEQYFGITVDPNYDARMPFYKHIGVPKAKYRQCKLAYRRGELKRSLPILPPPYPQAGEFTRQLRAWGCDVWLCTTRPYLSHDAVDDATRHNLRRNGVAYKGIIWGERKYYELVRTVGKERVVGVLDDLPEMCRQATRIGLRTCAALRDHNRAQFTALGAEGLQWYYCDTHEDTLATFKRWLNEWREHQ